MKSLMLVALVALFALTGATHAQGLKPEVVADAKQSSAINNVPPGLPPLAKSYAGGWKELTNGQWYSNSNKLVVLRENPLDEKGTWSADVIFTSYGGQAPCGSWTDVPGQLRWRQSAVVYFVITHPVAMCDTKWVMKFTRHPSGRLTWSQPGGQAEIYFEPTK